MTKDNYKIFSFFSGSGFLDLGFETIGYDIVMVNEYFKPFIKAYEFSRKKMDLGTPKYGYQNIDINEYLNERKCEIKGNVKDVRNDGNLVGFIGGPPCPDFSVGGKNKGQHGENGKLSLAYIQLIIELKPDFFLFENVKGLWKTQQHRKYFEELKGMLHKNGYVTTEKLINSLEYGVPQNRERIILIGVKKKLVKKESVKDNIIMDFPWDFNIYQNIETIKSMNWPGVSTFLENSVIPIPENIDKALTVEYWFNKNKVYQHPNSNDHFIPRSGLIKMQSIDEGDDCKKSYKRLHRWRYSPTVAYGNNEVHLHPYKARRLSVAEAMAIQSLPSSFELPKNMTLSNKFKTVGNGVPFLFAKGIAEMLDKYLNEI